MPKYLVASDLPRWTTFFSIKSGSYSTSILMGNIRVVGRWLFMLFKFIHLLKVTQLTLRSVETLSFKRWVSLYYWSRTHSNHLLVAITKFNLSTYGTLLQTAPEKWRLLKAHGPAVGLPTEEDMGNSEVGHNALGAGRIFEQGYV